VRFDYERDGRITRTEYDKKASELKEKQYELNQKLKDHTVADEKVFKDGHQLILSLFEGFRVI